MTLPARPLGALLVTGALLCGCASTPASTGLALTTTKEKSFSAKTDSVPSDLDGAVRQAQLQRARGDLDSATRTLSQLMLVAPDDPRVLGEYGKALVAKGDTDDALAFLAQAIAFQPNDWTLYSAQGVAYDQRGKYAAAQEAYNRALGLKPGEPSILSNAGLSRMQAGDLAGAEVLLRAAAENGADNARITRNLALLRDLKNSKAAVAAAPPVQPVQTAVAAKTPEPKIAASQPVLQTEHKPPVRPAGIAALAADPTVVMGPIPHDEADIKPPKSPSRPVKLAPALDVAQKVAAETKAPARLRPAQ